MLGLLTSKAFLITVGINIILALSLYIPFSAGQWSLGIGAFMSLGAYSASLLTVRYNVPFLVALPISGILVGLLGAVIAFPALRIKGIFLAIATLGIGKIVTAVFESWNYVGGLSGMSGMRGTTVANTYAIAAVCILVSWMLANSRFGLLCDALRQDEVAADSLGVHCTQVKVLAFSLGACMTAIAGALSAHYMFYIEPSVFDFNATILVVDLPGLRGIGDSLGGGRRGDPSYASARGHPRPNAMENGDSRGSAVRDDDDPAEWTDHQGIASDAQAVPEGRRTP